MPLTRFFVAASAVALIACPAIAAAQGMSTDTPPPAAAPAPTPPPAVVLPSIPKVMPADNIYDTLKASGQFTIVLKAVDNANLAPYLQKYPFTFFAPTDAAFNALPPGVLAKLTAQNDAAANQMQQILAYHLLTVAADSSQIKGHKGQVVTAEKQSLSLDGSDPDDLKVNDADIIQADIRTTGGGIVHVIDKVLVPPDSPYAAQLAPPPAAAPAPAATASAAPPAAAP
jgi:uncharacterized surface protein with fasciclin (FAS1) repeats